MNDIAKKLTYYRKKQNLTQGQLGELLHISAQAISKWENGQAEPSLNMIVTLAKLYGITTDELLTDISPADIGAITPTQAEKKNGGIRKYWYIPVIAVVLIGAIVCSVLFLPALFKDTPGEMIQDGSFTLHMTKDQVTELLGKPQDKRSRQRGDYSYSDKLNYVDAEYYYYYEEREPKTDSELWLGIDYDYLRLVFDNEKGLIEAFYCATPTQDMMGYGGAEDLTVTSYTLLLNNGEKTGYGTVVFSDGSVYFGELEENVHDYSNGTVKPLVTKIGVFALPK